LLRLGCWGGGGEQGSVGCRGGRFVSDADVVDIVLIVPGGSEWIEFSPFCRYLREVVQNKLFRSIFEFNQPIPIISLWFEFSVAMDRIQKMRDSVSDVDEFFDDVRVDVGRIFM